MAQMCQIVHGKIERKVLNMLKKSNEKSEGKILNMLAFNGKLKGKSRIMLKIDVKS